MGHWEALLGIWAKIGSVSYFEMVILFHGDRGTGVGTMALGLLWGVTGWAKPIQVCWPSSFGSPRAVNSKSGLSVGQSRVLRHREWPI